MSATCHCPNAPRFPCRQGDDRPRYPCDLPFVWLRTVLVLRIWNQVAAALRLAQKVRYADQRVGRGAVTAIAHTKPLGIIND